LKILIFNLRDIKNPSAGGAEVFTHEIAKHWVKNGNAVTLVSSNFSGGLSNELIDGVNIIRLGNIFSVFWKAREYYEKVLHGNYDIVIDEYTLKPFLSPSYVTEKVVFLIHEMAKEKYFYTLPPVISHIFYYFLEPKWVGMYKDIPTITVSNSTKEDLVRLGFKDIRIVPEGIGFKPIEKIPTKEEQPTLLFVGLLKKVNLVDHVIEAFKIVKKELPQSKLWIVGKGPELSRLKKKAVGLDVTFYGYVSEELKIELMRKAHVLLVPAIREGWGLVVTEANACGTPAIGYAVPGLKDSIIDGQTGLLTDPNINAFAKSIIDYLKDGYKQRELSKFALQWAKTFSWEKTASIFLNELKSILYD